MKAFIFSFLFSFSVYAAPPLTNLSSELLKAITDAHHRTSDILSLEQLRPAISPSENYDTQMDAIAGATGFLNQYRLRNRAIDALAIETLPPSLQIRALGLLGHSFAKNHSPWDFIEYMEAVTRRRDKLREHLHNLHIVSSGAFASARGNYWEIYLRRTASYRTSRGISSESEFLAFAVTLSHLITPNLLVDLTDAPKADEVIGKLPGTISGLYSDGTHIDHRGVTLSVDCTPSFWVETFSEWSPALQNFFLEITADIVLVSPPLQELPSPAGLLAHLRETGKANPIRWLLNMASLLRMRIDPYIEFDSGRSTDSERHFRVRRPDATNEPSMLTLKLRRQFELITSCLKGLALQYFPRDGEIDLRQQMEIERCIRVLKELRAIAKVLAA